MKIRNASGGCLNLRSIATVLLSQSLFVAWFTVVHYYRHLPSDLDIRKRLPFAGLILQQDSAQLIKGGQGQRLNTWLRRTCHR